MPNTKPIVRSAVMACGTQPSDAEWQAIVERDGASDGAFFYAVTTTGIFCRPSCSSRRPNRENVAIFRDVSQALTAGFRPCRKCHPEDSSDPRRAAVLRACEALAEAEGKILLERFAEEAGMSLPAFRRLFRETLGVAPREYTAAIRRERLGLEIERGETATGALFSAGFGSISRVYEDSRKHLGMTPGEYAKGGKGMEIRFATAPCTLGRVLAAATDNGICAVELGDAHDELSALLADRFPNATFRRDDEHLARHLSAIVALIDDPAIRHDLPLDVRGTAFQHRVWKALREIPSGSTTTYADLATGIGQPSATRAVAQACGANPVAVIVPCHRVVRSDGGLGGYRWGIERKKALLTRERKAGSLFEESAEAREQ